MKVRFYSPDDEWSADDVKITAPETLEIIPSLGLGFSGVSL